MRLKDIHTDSAVLEKLYIMAGEKMSEDDIKRQRASFVYGQMNHTSQLTKDDICECLSKFDGKPRS